LLGKHIPGIGVNPVYERNSVPQFDRVKEAMANLLGETA
jgi:hypothetical protein